MKLRFKFTEEAIAENRKRFGENEWMKKVQEYHEIRVRIKDGCLMVWAFKSSSNENPEAMWLMGDIEWVEIEEECDAE